VKIHRAERWALFEGDCVGAMTRLPENRFDAVVTDPPYELGFMGKSWDASGIAFRPETWAAALRVLKPGGHIMAFGGSRTFHRIACAIEDAGFDVRDTLSWLYGTGFPKSLNLGDGRGTALKPAWEPIIMARKPLTGTVAANVQQWGTGAMNVDGCRIGDEERVNPPAGNKPGGNAYNLSVTGMPQNAAGRACVGRWPANVVLDEESAAALDEQTGMLKSGSMKAGVNAGRKSAVYSADAGRPLAQDIVGSEVGASRFFYVAKASRAERDAGCEALPARSAGEATDRQDGTAGLENPRAGSGRTGGARNIHPTVKPVALMRWLVRLVTPPKGTVFDPFTGSGSTGVAALAEGFSFVGCEREAEYVPITLARLTHAAQEVAP
jgi:site-specific DNA-methyltransferase (adenine-specific)